MSLRNFFLTGIVAIALVSLIGGGTSAQETDGDRDRTQLQDQDKDQTCDGILDRDRLRDQDGAMSGESKTLRQQLQTKSEDKTTLTQRLRTNATEKTGSQKRAGISWQGALAVNRTDWTPTTTNAFRWLWSRRRIPDLRIGRWWYKAPPKPGREVDLVFEIQNIGCGIARGPILWEVTCHNWGFWNPVLNRIAVSYCNRSLLPGQSKYVYIRFPMTRRTHNLRLMADPSDHLGPPDNPPFGQKAKLNGWRSLKDGHIRERNERNNAKWVCIRVFNLWPDGWVKIPIPVVNPLPGEETKIELRMDKELEKLLELVEVGLLDENIAHLAMDEAMPPIKVVEPDEVIAEFTLSPVSDEDEIVLVANLLDNAMLDQPISFKVLATAVGPDGEPIFAEVTVVLEVQQEPEPVDDVASQ
jgi:hypothetical protein